MPSGTIVVISAPSGGGKTTIAHRLLEQNVDWKFSVSATTRLRREDEKHGVDYYFLTSGEFEQRVDNGELVEWEEIFGSCYGTLKDEVDRLLSDPSVRRIIFDIDVKGALSVRKAFPDDALLIFIAPPSVGKLRLRLSRRDTESAESLERRMKRAKIEMQLSDQFDCVIVNDDLDRAVAEVEAFIASTPGK
ncbi:MAG: guanylate kinase [Chlorobi bacterium]|nr:guanylate kinase [Chlorobiota bacterium]